MEQYNTNKEYLNTEEASFYLREIRGLQITTKSMRTAITRGSGCPYRKFGRFVVYKKEDLDTWAESKLSSVMSNSCQDISNH